jgi:8-oxo-dGTP diphosphatase
MPTMVSASLTGTRPSGPQVGVGVIVLRQGLVLLGQRKGSHGSGTWALPGGHLEFGETVEDCAAREVREESGLGIQSVVAGPYSNDLFEGRHYVTLFVVAHGPEGEPRVLEPEKCAQWLWCRWSELPQPLFQPLASIRNAGYVPPGAA